MASSAKHPLPTAAQPPLDPSQQAAMLHKAALISTKLQQVYPQAPKGFLHHSDPFTLLVAVVLSAQSLDSKVNQVTPHLFKIAPTPHKMAQLGAARIQQLIKQIGLAPQKANNIAKLSATICEKYQGQVPHTFEHLESLAGVGHKTASVVMMQAFNKPAFPVDTHIHRLACRWGCGHAKSVQKTEHNLKLWFPDSSTWGELHTRIILFGREHCPARNHDMDACPICAFAATDEARAANNANPKKFVAPVKHTNPYSVREPPSSALDSFSDPDFQPNALQKDSANAKSTPTRRRTTKAAASKRSQSQNAQQQQVATKARTRRRKAAEPCDQPDDQVETRPTRRRKAAQKQEQANDNAGTSGTTRRGGRSTRRQTGANSEQRLAEREQHEAEEMVERRRSSSRLALKREQNGLA